MPRPSTSLVRRLMVLNVAWVGECGAGRKGKGHASARFNVRKLRPFRKKVKLELCGPLTEAGEA